MKPCRAAVTCRTARRLSLSLSLSLSLTHTHTKIHPPPCWALELSSIAASASPPRSTARRHVRTRPKSRGAFRAAWAVLAAARGAHLGVVEAGEPEAERLPLGEPLAEEAHPPVEVLRPRRPPQHAERLPPPRTPAHEPATQGAGGGGEDGAEPASECGVRWGSTGERVRGGAGDLDPGAEGLEGRVGDL